jgi:glycosyl-4,4'-diaponeurosporenoate acyltransferase
MIDVPAGMALAMNVLLWAAWSVAIGYSGHRRAVESFAIDRWWSRLCGFEDGGGWYDRVLHIKRWKDWLPELGGLFRNGFAKRAVRRDRAYLERFVCETRRAEWVHWMVFLLFPVFALWNPPWAGMVMLLYATAANVPCILVQRYNRARLLRVLEAQSRR